MMYKTTFSAIRVDRDNLNKCLDPSLRVFNSNQELWPENFIGKYSNFLEEKEIVFCTIENEKEIIASCILVESYLNINGINLPVFFLTQVITEEKFRKMGYFSLLLEKVEELSRQKQVNILLVIARRAVSDLYWKFGFKGFSHFPEYNSKLTKKLLIGDKFRLADLGDLEILRNIYSSSNDNSNCKVIRSKLFWQIIITNQSELTYEVLMPRDKKNRNYIVLQNGVLIESSSWEDTQNSIDLFAKIESLLTQIKLDKLHSISKYLVTGKWQYSERFEPKEGHLYKLLNTIPSSAEIFFDEIAKEFGNARLEISPLDQW